ncbi:hypothetical protein ACIFOE_25775 [Paenibacillus sp. NRS-1783]|uniref:hypothetical protein n=1 Tax=Paenibacillus sp. NRS-1783 TaxID=3233907 RepID=UPI003D2B3C85
MIERYEEKLMDWLIYNDRRPIFTFIVAIIGFLIVGAAWIVAAIMGPSDNVLVGTLFYLMLFCTVGLAFVCFVVFVMSCIHFIRRLFGQKPDEYFGGPMYWTK